MSASYPPRQAVVVSALLERGACDSLYTRPVLPLGMVRRWSSCAPSATRQHTLCWGCCAVRRMRIAGASSAASCDEALFAAARLGVGPSSLLGSTPATSNRTTIPFSIVALNRAAGGNGSARAELANVTAGNRDHVARVLACHHAVRARRARPRLEWHLKHFAGRPECPCPTIAMSAAEEPSEHRNETVMARYFQPTA